MKDYQVSYYLGDMLHTYVISAFNEACAIQNVLQSIRDFSLFHDFQIKRWVQEWN